MPDYQYTFTELGKYDDSITACLAVLWPVMGRKMQHTSEADQLRWLDGLLMLWRGRISELVRKKWKRLFGQPLKVQYTRNCLPTMGKVTTNDKYGKECKLRDLCPWCYSRRVIAILKKVINHFKTAKDDKLVYARLEHRESFITSPTQLELKELLLKYRDITSKLALANSQICKGITSTVAISPDLDDSSVIIVSCGLVAILPVSERFDLVPTSWTFKEYLPPIAIEDKRAAVARAFHYPVGLLKGSSDVVIDILEAREKLRLTDSYGCFRG